MKFIIFTLVLIIGSYSFAAESLNLVFEPYLDKTVKAEVQRIGGTESKYGDVQGHAYGARLGGAWYGVGLGLDVNRTSVVGKIDQDPYTSLTTDFDNLNAYLSYTYNDLVRLMYWTSLQGKSSSSDNVVRKTTTGLTDSYGISAGFFLNKKVFINVSYIEITTEIENNMINDTRAHRADLYDTYMIGVSFPISVF